MNSKPFSLAWWSVFLATVASVIAGIGPAVDLLPPDWRGYVRPVVAIIGILVALVLRSALFDLAPDVPRKRPRVPPLPLLALALVLALVLAGCGATARVSTTAACATIYTAIGARPDYAPERARADLDAVHEACTRLTAPVAVDGGAP